jgi:hypothetical protein
MVNNVAARTHLWTLRVIKTPMANTHDGCADSQGSTVKRIHASTTIVLLCSLVDNLASVQSTPKDLPDRKRDRSGSSACAPTQTHIVAKLYLCNGDPAHTCQTYPKPSYTLLRQWSIENPLLAKFFGQTHGTSKDSPKTDILSKYYSLGMSSQSCSQRVPDCLIEVHLACLTTFSGRTSKAMTIRESQSRCR